MGKRQQNFSEALFEAGWVLESSQLCFTGGRDRGLARLNGPHHHGAGSQGTWAPSSPRKLPHPALHIDNYMQEGPHQEPATAGPSLQAQPCLEGLTAETEPFTDSLGQETLQSSGSSWTVAEALVAQRPGKLRLISRSQWMGMAFSRVERVDMLNLGISAMGSREPLCYD